MIKLSFWDWLAYACLGFLVAYFLLKILGIIHSPIELDVVALMSGAYFLGRYAMKMDFISDKLKEHSKILSEHSRILTDHSKILAEVNRNYKESG